MQTFTIPWWPYQSAWRAQPALCSLIFEAGDKLSLLGGITTFSLLKILKDESTNKSFHWSAPLFGNIRVLEKPAVERCPYHLQYLGSHFCAYVRLSLLSGFAGLYVKLRTGITKAPLGGGRREGRYNSSTRRGGLRPICRVLTYMTIPLDLVVHTTHSDFYIRSSVC